ncbi:MAG: nucleotidyltransferase domain-containing protein [Candidatus Bathyarchaeia archaeon]
MKVVPVKLSDSLTNAIDELVKSGMYNSRNEALRDAVRSLIEKTKLSGAEEKTRLQTELLTLAKTAASILTARYGRSISRITLFGSVAKGEATEESDIDLLVLVRDGDGSDWRRKFVKEVMPIAFGLERHISIKVLREDEFRELAERGSSFVREVSEHGIPV